MPSEEYADAIKQTAEKAIRHILFWAAVVGLLAICLKALEYAGQAARPLVIA